MTITPTTKRVTVEYPWYQLNDAKSALITIAEYPGRILLYSKSAVGEYRLMHEIQCNGLYCVPPDPLTVDIPSSIDTDDLTLFTVLVPNTMTNAEALALVVAKGV